MFISLKFSEVHMFISWDGCSCSSIIFIHPFSLSNQVYFNSAKWTGSDALPFRSAFRDVIFRQSWDSSVKTTTGVNHINLEPEAESILIQFKVFCPNIEKDTSEKFGSAWSFIATTFLNEYDKNCYEQDINDDVENDDIDEEFQEEDVDDEFFEDIVGDEFQDDDIDDDLDDEIQEDDIGDEFQMKDLDDEFQDQLE